MKAKHATQREERLKELVGEEPPEEPVAVLSVSRKGPHLLSVSRKGPHFIYRVIVEGRTEYETARDLVHVPSAHQEALGKFHARSHHLIFNPRRTS